MNSTAPPIFSLEPLDAFCASLRLWLFEMAALLLTLVDAKRPAARALRMFIAAEVRAVTIDTRHVFLALMCTRLRPRAPRQRRGRRRSSSPPGFRRSRREASGYRLITRVLGRGGGSLKQRLARLRDLLERRDYWIARLVRRYLRGRGQRRLIIVTPPARALLSRADALAPIGADTS